VFDEKLLSDLPSPGLHNSESSKGQIDQHKVVAGRKSRFSGVRNSERTNLCVPSIHYPQSSFCNIFCNWQSFRGPHVARGPHVVQAWPSLCYAWRSEHWARKRTAIPSFWLWCSK